MGREPKQVNEVYELLRRLHNEEKVSQDEMTYHLGRAIKNKENRGTWVRREIDSQKGSDALSVVEIDTEKSLLGLRVGAKKKRPSRLPL